jgi:hypothetical protein
MILIFLKHGSKIMSHCVISLMKKIDLRIIIRCNHSQINQKRCPMMKKNNQNWKNIYVLPYFETMEIMASYSFFIHMNVKKFKPKIHLIKF